MALQQLERLVPILEQQHKQSATSADGSTVLQQSNGSNTHRDQAQKAIRDDSWEYLELDRTASRT